MSSPIQCPQGHYCPEGSVLPLPCPVGTYNDLLGQDAEGDCKKCPATLYCDEEGMVAANTQKKCAAGYLCTEGADSAYPIELVNRGSDNNRKCPKGHYCTQGATSSSSCNSGTYQNSYGQSSCKTCPPGYYCGSTGIETVTTTCAAGYTCFEGATQNNPTDGVKGDLCPIGSKCAAGSAKALDCEDGKKTTTTGNAVCNNCDAGFYCIKSVEYDCPYRRYCPAGSVRGQICDAGTYNDDSKKLGMASQCKACPARQYCIDGTKGSDYCESGHICEGGAKTPLPNGDYDKDNDGDHDGDDDPNYICPLGRYCLKAGASGLNAPSSCSASKYTYFPGSDSIDDCLPCAAGYYCPTGGYEPKNCGAGHYCIKGSTSETECPINTVRITIGGYHERSCDQCPAGKFCNSTGLDTLTGKDCSVGHFCPTGTSEEIACPAGTYRNTTGAASESDCIQCPIYYYCESATVNPEPCTNGYECPAGSSLPSKCEAGQFCEVTSTSPNVITKIDCPQGYYCTQGTTEPVACDEPSAILCPTNSKFEGGQSTTCDAGYYLSGSACKYCDRGYVCLAGAEVSNPTDGVEGYICPRGHYCDPRISVTEVACPAGTYNPYTGKGYLSDCLSVPEGTYQSSTGQPNYINCGTGATSSEGATKCDCIGEFRWWKPAKNTCECKKGYTSSPSRYSIFSASEEYDSLDCSLML